MHSSVLQLFGRANLQAQLDMFRRLADRLDDVRSTEARNEAESTAIVDFLRNLGAGDRLDANFAHLTARMWPEHYRRSLETDVNELNLLVERRHIMLASVVAWQWLNYDCVNVMESTIHHIQNSSHPAPLKTWISDLTTHVYRAVVNKVSITLEAGDFLPHLKNAPKSITVTPRQSNSSRLVATVRDHVLAVVRQWLNFPTNTECIAAHFVAHVLDVSDDNPDVLLLHGLWKPYRSIKASVLKCPSWTKHTALKLSMLDPFVAALRTLPVADRSSEEAQLLVQISEAVKRCKPNLQGVTAQIMQLVQPTCAEERSAPGRSACMEIAPSASGFTAAPSVVFQEKALHAVKNFVLELVPLVSSSQPATLTRLQSLVMGNKDHFLPFREFAPSRQRVTSVNGPFHPENALEAGAFPSALVFRGLLFASSAVKHKTYGFFHDIGDWELFLDLEGYDPENKEIRGEFFVERAYGTPQHARTVHARTYANVYFEKEPQWWEFLAGYPDGPIPFMDFLGWTQEKTGWFDDAGKYHRGVRFPLIGPLAGYLLAADLTYTGLVTTPSIQEVGTVIRNNSLGSLAALVSLNLISGKKASRSEVVHAAEQLYDVLVDAMSADVREGVGFDSMTVEHVLCKYSRCMRELG